MSGRPRERPQSGVVASVSARAVRCGRRLRRVEMEDAMQAVRLVLFTVHVRGLVLR
jgi:hypothetical protein